jgi:two-component system OmpR family response regulator
VNERRLRVVVVDDDAEQIELLERLLATEGIDVTGISSPIGASNVVRKFEPDVVLIDVNIPSLSGDRLLSLLRRNAPEQTRLVLFSACDESRLRSLALEANADGWMPKSGSVEQLARRLRAIAARPAAGAPETPAKGLKGRAT